jgi:hypothetical protein
MSFSSGEHARLSFHRAGADDLRYGAHPVRAEIICQRGHGEAKREEQEAEQGDRFPDEMTWFPKVLFHGVFPREKYLPQYRPVWLSGQEAGGYKIVGRKSVAGEGETIS